MPTTAVTTVQMQQWSAPRARSGTPAGVRLPPPSPTHGFHVRRSRLGRVSLLRKREWTRKHRELDQSCATRKRSVVCRMQKSLQGGEDEPILSWDAIEKSGLLPKVGTMLGLLVLSRVGIYIPLPGIDRVAFAEAFSKASFLGYVDALAGGGISNVGIFSLGIVPYINSSIVFQILASAFPSLKRMLKEEGEAGRRKFQQYIRYGALGLAVAQGIGQTLYLRPYAVDFDLSFFFSTVLLLVAGSQTMLYIGERLGELKLGNGTSILIFSNIVSSLPSSLNALEKQASKLDSSSAVPIYILAFLLVTMGVIYVQEAERRIPINYANRYQARNAGISSASYLPFKVNATGVMPVIFSSSLLALPSSLARLTASESIAKAAILFFPGQALYVPSSVILICFFNYYYTFLQLNPDDMSEELKKSGASVPGIRPGQKTSDFISGILNRMSVLGSVFLGGLALTPPLIEGITGLTALRGFTGTSILILVGVATDTVRRFRSELLMSQYRSRADDMDVL